MNVAIASRSLMYAGLIPFFGGAIAIVLELNSWWVIDDIGHSFVLYALAIASFMSGVYWGLAQLHGNKKRLLFQSNVMVILPWVAFLFFGDGVAFYSALAYVFFKQYLLDRQLTIDGIFEHAYLRDRKIIAITVCSLMLMIATFNAYWKISFFTS